MSTYAGHVTPGEMDWTVTVDGEPLDPRHDLWNHSPDGFAWGYSGSGPAQLALAILAHFFNEAAQAVGFSSRAPDLLALRLHQSFKAAVIARLPREEGFTLTTDQVGAALSAIAARKNPDVV